MNKQMTLSSFYDELAQTKTSKKAFLKQMEQIIPIVRVDRNNQARAYYKGERGNKP